MRQVGVGNWWGSLETVSRSLGAGGVDESECADQAAELEYWSEVAPLFLDENAMLADYIADTPALLLLQPKGNNMMGANAEQLEAAWKAAPHLGNHREVDADFSDEATLGRWEKDSERVKDWSARMSILNDANCKKKKKKGVFLPWCINRLGHLQEDADGRRRLYAGRKKMTDYLRGRDQLHADGEGEARRVQATGKCRSLHSGAPEFLPLLQPQPIREQHEGRIGASVSGKWKEAWRCCHDAARVQKS